MHGLTLIKALFRRLVSDRAGSIAIKAALAIPAISVLALGAVDLTAVNATRDQLQNIADAAALAGANELGLAVEDDAPVERGKAWVASQLAEWSDAPSTQVDVKVIALETGARALQVDIQGHRESFFGNLLPPGGWKFRANAVASSVALTPLCVLSHGAGGIDALQVRESARINAPGCMVHSNKEILVSGGRISAAAVQAVDWARGMISPTPATGAAPIEDPFTELPLNPLRLCTRVTVMTVTEGRHYIPAGVHCGGIMASGDAEVVLQPGDHWFMAGALTMSGNSVLSGSDVVLIFDAASLFDFRDNAAVNLNGRKSGPFAGFVMAASRGNRGAFKINSDNVENLLGVIYIPEATLRIDGSADVARDSAWTVIVSKWLEVRGSSSVYINANYDGSQVPVPGGVGPRIGGSRLVK